MHPRQGETDGGTITFLLAEAARECAAVEEAFCHSAAELATSSEVFSVRKGTREKLCGGRDPLSNEVATAATTAKQGKVAQEEVARKTKSLLAL